MRDALTPSALGMLIFGILLLYGGLGYYIRIAMKKRRKRL